MNEIFLIYPHQLFESIVLQNKIHKIILVEDPLLFTQFAFNKKKLLFHRASMKCFEEKLKKRGFLTQYIDSQDIKETEDISIILKQSNVQHVHIFELVDDWLDKRLKVACKSSGIGLTIHPSPNFFLNESDIEQEFQEQNKFLMASFYARQRKRFNILIEDGRPTGGKWSFDIENRKKLPKNLEIPCLAKTNESPFVKEASQYIVNHFGNNYGSVSSFFYPISHLEAQAWLNKFLEERFFLYGPYQDAMNMNNSFLFHSLISPLLNTGLLTPDDVIKKTLDFSRSHEVPLSCLEGFIRQILGWREFVRGVYCTIGGKERTKNFWGHKRKLPHSFWKGLTGIDPVDNVIKKVTETGYANHIERLMIMSNFMLLCEIDPDDIYRWFMELFIDAFDWVMVPNVYGMGQYADGGMITTKPYISGSNYINKMSNFPKGNWTEIWDSLYWNFIGNHLAVFSNNPRCYPIVQQLKKMENSKLQKHRTIADNFLKNLT